MSNRNTHLRLHRHIAMRMILTTVIVICLGGLVSGLVDSGTAANVKWSARQTKLDDSDSTRTQPMPEDSATKSLENTGTGYRRSPSTRESAVKFDSPTRVVTNDYELELKNASSDNVLPSSLIEKIVSILRKRPSAAETPTSAIPSVAGEPNKQLFGGRLPPFIERIIQRIQNYFSVYNPPEYFESNRPPATSAAVAQQAGITLICSNSTSGSVSCNEMNSSEELQEEEQEQGETLEVCGGVPSNLEENVAASQDEYNVVVTHTIVQDSSLNVYSPAPVPLAADSTQMVSNVVVILEPAVGQYSPPPLDNPDKNKFYVYVNPTSANNNQQRLKTWNESAVDDKVENFQPYVNTTYTVIIRGDKLQEYNTDLQNADDNFANPEIAIYIRNSTKQLKKCKLPSQPAESEADAENADCEQSAPLASRSILTNSSDQDGDDDETTAAKAKNNENSNKVPNINLMLVPPNDQPQKSKNKSCSSKNKVNKNPQLEYYVLKPDTAGNKGKTDDKEKPAFYLQRTSIDTGGTATLSQTYLPPPLSTLSSAAAESSSSLSSDADAQQRNDKTTSRSFDLFAAKNAIADVTSLRNYV